jgi:hypothetical protein
MTQQDSTNCKMMKQLAKLQLMHCLQQASAMMRSKFLLYGNWTAALAHPSDLQHLESRMSGAGMIGIPDAL